MFKGALQHQPKSTKCKLTTPKKKQSIKRLFLKRTVLSLFFFKTDTNELFLTSYGKAFHSVGAATEKDHAPYVFKLQDGVNRRLDIWMMNVIGMVECTV